METSPEVEPKPYGDAFALLTDRQAEVVSLILQGFRPAQIAALLSIAEHTVPTHRRDAVKRLRADGSPCALTLARRCSRFERKAQGQALS